VIACITTTKTAIYRERMRDATLMDKPLALMDGNGAVLVVSEEAELFGVRPGQAASGARTLCPGLATLPYDRPAYETAAEAVWNLLAEETSFVEPMSPEMCYATLDDRLALSLAKALTPRIAEVAGPPVRIGLGRSKVIARHAAACGRDGAPLCIAPEDGGRFLASLPVADVVTDSLLAQRLYRLNIVKLGDIAAIDPHALARPLKAAFHMLRQLAQGNDNDPVHALWPPPVVRAYQSFEEPVAMEEPLRASLEMHARRIAQALQRDGRYCRIVTLTLTEEDGGQRMQVEKLAVPTAGSCVLFRAALRLLSRAMHTEEHMLPIQSYVLEASGIDRGGSVQLPLLDVFGNNLPAESARKLEAVLGYARSRWGAEAVVPASLHLHECQRTLFTGSLGHRLDEAIQVEMSSSGEPVGYTRRSRTYPVIAIQDRWREGACEHAEPADRWVYRVQTPQGLTELCRSGTEWRLRAMAD
jgi:DNA polymerase-4